MSSVTGMLILEHLGREEGETKSSDQLALVCPGPPCFKRKSTTCQDPFSPEQTKMLGHAGKQQAGVCLCGPSGLQAPIFMLCLHNPFSFSVPVSFS